MWLLFLVLILIGVHVFRKLFKLPKFSHVVFITGSPKTGKSTLSCRGATKTYDRALFVYRIRRLFYSIFSKKRLQKLEKPCLYSNVPLRRKYVPLTEELIERKKRFAENSVIYIQEASLFADSMDYKDEKKNEALKLFNKLIGHECNGTIFYDSQAASDVHVSIKRCLNEFYYIHHNVKWIPFFVILYVREMYYSYDQNGVVNTMDDDIESAGLRRIIIPKRIWKVFDYRCYSGLTDDLPLENTEVDGRNLPDLKVRSIFTVSKKEEKK